MPFYDSSKTAAAAWFNWQKISECVFVFCSSPLPSYETQSWNRALKADQNLSKMRWSVLKLGLKNILIIVYFIDYSQGKTHLDTMVTAYPVQARISEITGPAGGNLVIRPTWCHSLFWNQMPLKWCSTAAAPWTHARPPVGAASRTAPQSAGFLSTRTHSSAWPPVCHSRRWPWSTGLPWSVMHPWIFCEWRPKTTLKKGCDACSVILRHVFNFRA